MGKILLFLIGFAFLVFPKLTFADVANPEFLKATCNPGEQIVECSNGRYFNSSARQDECVPYRFNPLYHQLTGSNWSSDHGQEKFCLKTSTFLGGTIEIVKTIIRLVILTLILEVPVFFFFGYRSFSFLKWVVVVNLLSVPAMNILGLFLFSLPYMKSSGVNILFGLEIIVILFEAFFLSKKTNAYEYKRTAGVVITANIISAFLGTFIALLF